MACAEYSFCNKPVITFENSPERNHISTLGKKGLYYKDEETVLEIMKSFEKKPNEDWNAYSDLTPEKVMQKFDKVFLSKI
jgi:hypothetical protein|tara:strand:- start:930 stop:1169 length:240 start_codon:yes stop_codon:yes gene_type:complete